MERKLGKIVAGFFLCLSLILIPSGVANAQSIAGNAFLYRSGIWQTRLIPVCWETSGFDTDKERVRLAIKGTWERESALHFTGWNQCPNLPASSIPGIHIKVGDDWPHTKGLGAHLNGVAGGMVLNFGWSGCGSLTHNQCVEWVAVHEFGHALSFAHEQNRDDTPSGCSEKPQGTSGDIVIGDWDADSVMNYCNRRYNNNGQLSGTDVQALRAHYGEPIYQQAGDGERLLAAAWAGDRAGVLRYLTEETFQARSPEGLNALMMAVNNCTPNHLGIIQDILNSGFLSSTDINTRNLHRNTALEIALGTDSELRAKNITQPRCLISVPMLRAFGAQ